MTLRAHGASFAVAAALAAAPTAFGQKYTLDEVPPPDAVVDPASAEDPPEDRGGPHVPYGLWVAQPTPAPSLRLLGGAEHFFESDLSSGTFRRTRGFGALDWRFPVANEFDMSLGFQYDYSYYSFKGPTTLAASDPWQDINTIRANVFFHLDFTNDITIYGGPILEVAAESGADWGDALKWGGFGAVVVRGSDDFVIGVGLYGMSQLEGEYRLWPTLILNWEITDGLRLTSAPMPAFTVNRTGWEVIWDIDRTIHLAVGASYEWQRFRLDEGGGSVPDGIGRISQWPIWLRLGLGEASGFQVNVFGGFMLEGNLKVSSSSNNPLSQQDFDPDPFLAITGSLVF
jgi:hypothetical protein